MSANPSDAIPEYLKTLKENNVLQTPEIVTLSFSLDDENYCNIIIHSNTPEDCTTSDHELWGEQATKLLLDRYENYLPCVGPLKRFKKKKNLWVAISEDLRKILDVQKTPVQCENWYKTVMKRKKNITSHNRQTGRSPQTKIHMRQNLLKLSHLTTA